MLKELIDGSTSFELPKSIAKMMEKEKVSDEYFLVTKYYSIRPRVMKQKKYIYLAYDSESMVAFNSGYVELEHFDRVYMPEIIVVFGLEAYHYYKRHGQNVYLLPLGYDDSVYKPTKHTNEHDIGFVGTIDTMRWSDFYLRNYTLESLKALNMFDVGMGGQKYDKINRIYSKCIAGYNDIIRPSPNMRLFEIPSYGAFMLANDMMKTIESNYKYPLKENKHYMVYKNFADLVNKLHWAKENVDETNARAEEAKKLILKQPLSAEVRAFVDKCNLR